MQLIEVPTETWAFLTCRSGLSGPEVSAALERSFEELTEVIARGGVRTQGQPRAHFRYRDAEGNRFEIGFPIHPDDERIAKEAGLNVKMLGGDGWDSLDLLQSGGDAILGSY
ncbi:MAG: hypothetical protein ABMA14_21185, partial [Hyphomonadaceae bacterium]